ncbi:MAG: hypothetical protein IH914_06965 [candidate division Zixibacteria bacterium]|nr:hypothetical protein [candidate division Zixibacteria bacterium]
MNSRNSLVDVDLDSLREQFSGARYSELVERQMRSLNCRLELAIQGAIAAFTEEERIVAEHIIDIFNDMASESSFWTRDCADVFDQICTMFSVLLSERGVSTESRVIFNMFQLVTTNFAEHARKSKTARKFMGIRKSFFRT